MNDYIAWFKYYLEFIEVLYKSNIMVDIEEEIKRLETEKSKLESEVERSNKILSNKGFLAKAPKEKADIEKEKLEKYTKLLKETTDRLNNMKA